MGKHGDVEAVTRLALFISECQGCTNAAITLPLGSDKPACRKLLSYASCATSECLAQLAQLGPNSLPVCVQQVVISYSHDRTDYRHGSRIRS
jgi:hypothetical protein